MINRVRGTQDSLDTKLLTFFIDTARQHLERHNFSFIETPILEHTKLFIHSLGTHTDVVSKEMYVFKAEDDEDSICLRPEMTASTIRAYAENSVTARPWKVFSHGPAFRKERPQKGRWRQFSQFNIELINTKHILHDCSLLAMLNSLFIEKFHLDTMVLKLNYLGCLDDRARHREQLLTFLETHAHTICETCTTRKSTNTLRIFDCKSPACQTLYEQAPKIIDCLCTTCSNEWQELKHTLELLSVSFIVDPKLVRGLDYYNRLVFEFTSAELGSQSTFCGGGRYTLGKEIGGREDYDSVGVALGIGRILMLLESRLDKLAFSPTPTLHVILPLTADQKHLATLLFHNLTTHGLTADIIYDEANMTNLMKKAQRLNPASVLIIGPDEQAHGTVVVKDMSSGASSAIKHQDLISELLVKTRP